MGEGEARAADAENEPRTVVDRAAATVSNDKSPIARWGGLLVVGMMVVILLVMWRLQAAGVPLVVASVVAVFVTMGPAAIYGNARSSSLKRIEQPIISVPARLRIGAPLVVDIVDEKGANVAGARLVCKGTVRELGEHRTQTLYVINLPRLPTGGTSFAGEVPRWAAPTTSLLGTYKLEWFVGLTVGAKGHLEMRYPIRLHAERVVDTSAGQRSERLTANARAPGDAAPAVRLQVARDKIELGEGVIVDVQWSGCGSARAVSARLEARWEAVSPERVAKIKGQAVVERIDLPSTEEGSDSLVLLAPGATTVTHRNPLMTYTHHVVVEFDLPQARDLVAEVEVTLMAKTVDG